MQSWTHIAVSWNNTEKNVNVALNGTVRQVTPMLNFIIKGTVHSRYFLGIKGDKYAQSWQTGFHGYMRHLMVFNKRLDEQQIKMAMCK